MFYARYQHGKGKTRRFTYTSLRTKDKDVALARLHSLNQGDQLELLPSANQKNITSHLLSDYIKSKQHLKHIKNVSYQLNKVFRLLDCLDKTIILDPSKYEHVIHDVNLSDGAKAYRYRTLRGFFNWMVQQGKTNVSPINSVRKVKKTYVDERVMATNEDLEKIFKAYDRYQKNMSTKPYWCAWKKQDWFKACILLIEATGIRRSQIDRLQWSQFDEDFKGVRVQAVKFEKGRYSYYYIKNPKAAAELKKLKAKSTSTYCFIGYNEQPIKPEVVTRAFKKYVKLAEVCLDLHIHGLRHKSVTDDLKAGVAPHLVSAQHKHHSVDFTMKTYAHLDNQAVIDGYSKIYR